MRRITQLGTQVRLPDGREGTVVYNGLDGVGIKWGTWYPKEEDFVGTSGGLHKDSVPNDWPWKPDAMLREPYAYAGIPCVGEEWEIIGPQEAGHEQQD